MRSQRRSISTLSSVGLGRRRLATSGFIALGLVLLLGSYSAVRAATAWLQPDPGAPFEVVSNGTTTICSNIPAGKTYRITNDGPDDISVRVYDEDNDLISITTLTPGNSYDAGVPTGGDCKVKDAESNTGQGATGNYKIV